MELLRADSGLRNSFLRLRKLVANSKPVLNVQDLGATVATTISVSSAAAAIVSMVPMPGQISATVYMAK